MIERLFVSSVQKELAAERRAVRDFVHGDALLRRFFDVFLFEDLPASDRRSDDAYLEEVARSGVYLGLFGDDYGSTDVAGVSPTEREFDEATRCGRMRLIFVRGADDARRDPRMLALIRKAGGQLIRKRVTDVADLTGAVYASLVEHLERTGRLRMRPFDAAACPGARIDDLSPDLLDLFLSRAQSQRGYALGPGTPMPTALTHLDLLDGVEPSHAAVLLFGTKPQRFLPSSEVKCMHFHGKEMRKPIPSYQIVKGTVFELVDGAVDFVLSKLAAMVGTRAESNEAPLTYEIPREAVAEAIVNAVAHRDYASNASVQVVLFADRLEVWNPGRLPTTLSFEQLTRPHPSIPHNPLLAEPMFLARYVEKAGSGILDMIALCREAGLSAPGFRQEGGEFVQTLWRPEPEEAPPAETGQVTEQAPQPTLMAHPDPDLVHYLERLRAAHRDLPLVGFATRVRLPIRLESVYVPLRARVIHHAMESEHQKGGTFRDPAFEAGEDREVPFDEAMSLARQHGFRGAIVLGDPGTGKTTLLKHFVLAVTDPAVGPARLGLPPETVPVLLELRRLGHPAAGLWTALISAIERVAPALDAAAFANRLLRRDHLLVLVDGLDEIADAAERTEVSRWLEEAAVVSLPYSVFVVTSRYAGYKGDARLSGRFLELHVRDLTEEEARRFLRDWYGAVEVQAELGRAPEVAARLAKAAADDLALRIFTADDPRTVSLRDLATKPLLLQILCLVHRDRKHLPERRVELYGECCAVLLQLWREAKGMPVVLSAVRALKLLQPLAFWLHTQGRKEAGVEEVLPLLAVPLRELGRNPEEGEALLEAIRDQSGLLVNVGTAWAFLHLSFQEYLSARHLQDQVVRAPELLTELAGHFGETWWREVVLLAVGLDNPSLFEPLLATLLRQQALQRDIRLADDLLRDASAVTPRPLLAALREGIASAQERYHALRLLRAIPGWDAEPLPDGAVGKDVVVRLLADPDPQAAGMAAELLGIEREVPRRSRRGGPAPGEERLHDADGTVLLYVPGGEYTLGSEDSPEEKPVHRVVLSPFWLAKYPVTNEQYRRFLSANPDALEPQYWKEKQFNEPQQPVVGVRWEEAQVYCRWAGLRLPSEAQWEAAARGTDGRRYPWGNAEPTSELANFGGHEGGTTPVGLYPKGAGPFGALDQAGNVWEWCEDVWNPAAYRERDGRRDPIFTTGDPALRCLRGGSWVNAAGDLAVAFRSGLWASLRHRLFGFRCLLPAIPEP